MSTSASTGQLSTQATHPAIEPAQQTAAKLAGFLYLLQMATAMFGYFARNQMIVRGDAVQTATNVAASERLFRITIATDLITIAAVILLLWALYVILQPINRNVALLAAFFRLMENAVAAATVSYALVALRFLAPTPYLQVFDPSQLAVLARVLIGGHGSGLSIAFVFCGLGSALFSYLWWKSRYIPRALAAWGIFSSLVLTLVTLVVMVFPALGTALGLTYMAPMFFYEVGLGLWLLIKGLQARA